MYVAGVYASRLLTIDHVALTSHQITGPRTDLHSGIEGGAVTEPMIDMYVK